MRVMATHGGAVAGIDDVSGIKAQCRGEAGQGQVKVLCVDAVVKFLWPL